LSSPGASIAKFGNLTNGTRGNLILGKGCYLLRGSQFQDVFLGYAIAFGSRYTTDWFKPEGKIARCTVVYRKLDTENRGSQLLDRDAKTLARI
jgi:hypothetical protein